MEYDIANIFAILFAIIANIAYREYIRDIANIFAISNRDIVNVCLPPPTVRPSVRPSRSSDRVPI